MYKISIIVPAHNEAENLHLLMEELLPVLLQYDETKDFEIVIVNDNSTDRTPAIIEELGKNNPRIRPLHRHTSPGFGNAVKEGMKNATGDIIIPVMGDLSDDPEDIPKLVRKMEEGYDIARSSALKYTPEDYNGYQPYNHCHRKSERDFFVHHHFPSRVVPATSFPLFPAQGKQNRPPVLWSYGGWRRALSFERGFK